MLSHRSVMGAPMGKKDSLKSLLLCAWRERWDEQVWGIALKQVLPRGVSGDVYDLAPTMLQMATIGPTLKTIIFRYLKHSLCSGVISHRAVLEAVATFRSFDKVHCVSACLDMVGMVESQLQCRGKQEECLALACSILALAGWLAELTAALDDALQLSSGRASPDTDRLKLAARLCSLTTLVTRNRTLVALLYLGRLEEPAALAPVLKTLSALEARHDQLSGEIQTTVRNLRWLCDFAPADSLKTSDQPRPVVYSVQCLIQVDLACFRVRPPQALADRLLLLQQTQGLTASALYYNIMRTCCEGLTQTVGTEMGRYWVQFTYHRLPKLMACLHAGQTPAAGGPSADLSSALWRLVTCSGQLVDLVDVLYNRDSQDTLELLLTELVKSEVLAEPDLQRVMELRGQTGRVASLRQMQSVAAPGGGGDSPTSILRADPTVRSILSTMEVQQQESGISKISTVLYHMLGPSQHLVIGAAVGIGKVQQLMKHLILLNSVRMPSSSESSTSVKNQAILFEISFLIVMTTVKNYGLEALPAAGSLRCSDTGAEPFLLRWIRLFYRATDASSVLRLTELGDQTTRFCQLFDQLMTPGANLLSSPVRWDEVCLAIPSFIYWLMLSWCDGYVTQEQVRVVVDNMNRQRVCLSVCVVVFLNSVLQSCDERLAGKARLLVNMFLSPVPAESLPAGDQAQERLTLAQDIMRHVLEDYLPPDSGARPAPEGASPLLAELSRLWEGAVSQGSLSAETVGQLRRLLARGGAAWFVRSLVSMVLEYPFQLERDRAVEMALAVFHLDLPLCALALASHVLSDFFGSEQSFAGVSEPKLAALARMTVTCLLLAMGAPGTGGTPDGASREYQHLCYQLLVLQPAAASLELPASSADVIAADEYQRTIGPAGEQPGSAPLDRAICLLAAQVTATAHHPRFTMWTYFCIEYIREGLRQGGDRLHRLFAPLTLSTVWRLMCLSPASFTPEMLVSLIAVKEPAGRKMAAKLLCQLHSLQNDEREESSGGAGLRIMDRSH